MTSVYIIYQFKQRFRVDSRSAYDWCTDYDEDDFVIMGIVGRRIVRKIYRNIIILLEIVKRGKEENRVIKLVELDPTNLSWTNTHISGPSKYSQFSYKITSEEGSKSRLDFTGLQLFEQRKTLTAKKLSRIRRKLLQDDRKQWALLAKKMEVDVKQ